MYYEQLYVIKFENFSEMKNFRKYGPITTEETDISVKNYLSLPQRKQNQYALGSDGFREKKMQVSKMESGKALV